jgi:hypothetical protein
VALPATTSAMSAATPTRKTPTLGVRCCMSVPFLSVAGKHAPGLGRAPSDALP